MPDGATSFSHPDVTHQSVPHPDAAVLAACAAFMEAHRLYDVTNYTETSDEEDGRLYDAWRAALDVVTETPARTLDGWRAKAQAMIAAFEMDVPGALDEAVESVATPHEMIAWRFAHDVLLGSAAA